MFLKIEDLKHSVKTPKKSRSDFSPVFVAVLLNFVVGQLPLSMAQESKTCRVEQCEVKLTPEHVAQISMILKLGITEEQCLKKLLAINLPQFSAVYCPEEQICGLDIQPEKTKALRFLANQTCITFAMERGQCKDVEKQLSLSG